MLYEIKNVRQRKGEGKRRWFTDDFWDLFTWSDQDGFIDRFQLAYGKPDNERSLTWGAATGFKHTAVDSGDPDGSINMSPILVEGGEFPGVEIVDRFKRDAAAIPFDVSEFVQKKALRIQPGSKRYSE